MHQRKPPDLAKRLVCPAWSDQFREDIFTVSPKAQTGFSVHIDDSIAP